MSLPGAFSNDHSIAGTHCQDVLLDVTTSPCLIPKVKQSSIFEAGDSSTKEENRIGNYGTAGILRSFGNVWRIHSFSSHFPITPEMILMLSAMMMVL